MKENIDKAEKNVNRNIQRIDNIGNGGTEHLMLIQSFCSPVKNMSIFYEEM